jgi:penicillin-binding protein 1A
VVVDAPICIGNWCPQNYGHSYGGSMTLTQALTHSINTVAVRLSIMIGKGNPKVGRAKIVETARKMGLRTPLPDTPSLPIGADEVTVLDHTAAYATFPNLGKAVAPHAVLEVRSPNGQVVWRFDRDGKKPEQAISQQVATQMIFMMNKVVEEGTGKRAILDGVRAAGKTGTTNAYRDAWFMGYTGNYVCGIWFGNDNYDPTNRMTGGSLPAMTWHEIMAYAHQGIEVKNLPGLPPAQASPSAAAVAENKGAGSDQALRPTLLTKRGADILQRLEHLLENASRAMASSPGPGEQRGTKLEQPNTIAKAAEGSPVSRGN